MNKFVKLPLFLGISGAICAGLLAVVNEITTPYIEKRLENERNANYLALMGVESADEFKDGKVTDDLKAGFVTGIKEVYVGGSLLGVVYDGALNDGFSDWTLQLGIKDGKYTGLKFSSPAPDGVGLPMITKFSADLVGKSIDTAASDICAGVSSMSTNPMLRDYVALCAANYTATYAK